MHTFVALALLFVARVQADNYGALHKLPKRQGGFSNTTLIYTNTSTSATPTIILPTVSSLTPTSGPTDVPTSLSASNNTSASGPTTINPDDTNTPTLIAGPTLGIINANQTIKTVYPIVNTTITSPGCAGSVTYYNSIPPTVYMTVTESYEVTVTASNVSITETETLITPPPACLMTILAVQDATGIEASVTVASYVTKSRKPPKSTKTSKVTGGKQPQASNSPEPPGFAPTSTAAGVEAPVLEATVVLTTLYPNVQYTSTVIVTKKTPVQVVVPPTSEPPIFQNPATPTDDAPEDEETLPVNPNQNFGGPRVTPSSTRTASNNGNSNAVINPVPTPTPAPNTGGGLVAIPPGSSGLGSIIDSIINSPFVPAGPSRISNTPALTTTIDNVGVSVFTSSVVIGTTAVPIQSSDQQTVVRVNGQDFTVRASEIVAPGTTVAIPSPVPVNQASPTSVVVTAAPGVVITVGSTAAVVGGSTIQIGTNANPTTVVVSGQTISLGPSGVGLASTTVAPIVPLQNNGVTAPPTVVTAAPGLVITVGASTAVVDGTTFRIGAGVSPTSVVVDGQTISIGPSGVGLSSTTIAPAAGVIPPFVVETVGGLTLSVGPSQVVIDSTTYRIGSGAPTLTTIIDGQTVSIGPSGVAFKTTTVRPTTATARTGTKSKQTGAAATASASGPELSENSGTRMFNRTPVLEILGWLSGICLVVMAF